MKSLKILFIATSHDKLGTTSDTTGAWLEEIATPYYLFIDAGAMVTIASPGGGPVPLDPKSQAIIIATPPGKRFLKDSAAMYFLGNAVRLEGLMATDFDAVFLAGGHGAMWDIAENKQVNRLLATFNKTGKPIGSVCHGVAGLLSLKGENGESLLKDKMVTGFSNSEEGSAGLTLVVPFLLETELVALGGRYTKGPNYESHVVTDGNIITGQNAASSEEVSKRMLALLLLQKQNRKMEPAIDN
jgi:putative intracellular protease/amidase